MKCHKPDNANSITTKIWQRGGKVGGSGSTQISSSFTFKRYYLKVVRCEH